VPRLFRLATLSDYARPYEVIGFLKLSMDSEELPNN